MAYWRNNPDSFIEERLLDPALSSRVLSATGAGRRNLVNPPKTVDEFLQSLRAFKLTRTAILLEKFVDQI